MTMMWNLGIEGLDALVARDRARAVAQLVEALAEVDLLYLRAKPETPRLYESRVRYRESPSLLADVATVLRLGEADCKSLTAWRIAEHRLAGRDAAARVQVYPAGDMHVLLAFPMGSLEDPVMFLEKALP